MSTTNPATSNPYLEDLSHALPFDRLRPEHIEPAIEVLLTEAQAKLDALHSAEPTWAATFGALDLLGARLETAVGLIDHLESVLGEPELRAAYDAVRPKISGFYARIGRDEALYAALNRAAQTLDLAALSPARQRYVQTTLDAFRRNGVHLPAAQKKQLDEIDVALAEATNRFSQNVVDATDAFSLLITDADRLAGLPSSAVAAARAAAEAEGQEGWRFTLSPPVLTAVLTYAQDRALREALYRASYRRAAQDPYDNRALLAQILTLRAEKAKLLGYKDFSDLVLEARMVKSGEAAWSFVKDLRAQSEAAFEREQRSLEAFYRAQAGAEAPALQAWDLAFWAEKQRMAEFDFDEEALRPYFSAAGVLRGLFELVGRLYGVEVRELTEPSRWHESVQVFALEQGGVRLGQFYADLYPRPGKRAGAWMCPFTTGKPEAGVPHMGQISGNLTPPIGDKPALLTHREVETIFHEFGHLLHHLLTTCELHSQAGTNVAWDFVELPSQIMENWCWQREALDLFARHYETGEAIPQALFEKMSAARTFRAASAQMRQLGFGTVDLALHRQAPAGLDAQGLVDYARAQLAPFTPAELPEDYTMILSFSHLFASPVGYAAAYYSYKWAEVLDADAFTRFEAEGIFNPKVGAAFRELLLSQGDSADPAALFRAFMGRDPDPKALLRRSGLAA